ncbi:MAG: sulfatase [Planctomycetes bacterium]|nr:sulfatase [Planctomycetota bacterium]
MNRETNGPERGVPPNLLFVFADQLGAAYMGCYGHPQVQTPNLDRLAGQSVFFRNAYTATPLCTPFRGTLFTGRYPVQTGIWRNSYRIPGSETTLAELFNEAGYATSYVGKWHLAGPPRKTWVPPIERGGFQDFIGWDCGHVRHINQEYFDGDDPEILKMSGHETDAMTDIARERLRRCAEGDKPFCMFVSYQAPHPFCEPPDEYLDLYRDRSLSYRPTVDHDARFTGYGEESAEMPVREWTERYFGEISHLDAAIGRLLGELEGLGLADDTAVVFSSDHGDMGGCRGLFEKAVPYEEASWIPLIVRLPGQEKGRETDVLFSSVDFLPTLLGLCGLPPAGSAEGVDYAPLLRCEGDAERREHLIMQFEGWSCIRCGDDKLTLDPEGTIPRELYRLSDAPFEQTNLVAEAEEQRTVEELQEAYLSWLEDARTRVGNVAEASMVSPALRESDADAQGGGNKTI